MPYAISIAPAALRSLRKLDAPVRKRIETAIDRLTDAPRPTACVKLSGVPNGWRLRVGDWRILYAIDDRRQTVLVVDVGHRREIYRGL
jgi:mRNA interferase RelE/StbE